MIALTIIKFLHIFLLQKQKSVIYHKTGMKIVYKVLLSQQRFTYLSYGHY